jgi:amino acid adenylation domain-containing protein
LPVEFDPFAGPEILQVIPAIEPQQEVWISCRLGGEDANRSYNESVSLRLTGPFDRPAMERALLELISRHEVLRSVFNNDGSKIIVFRNLPVNLRYEDLSAESPAAQQAFIDNFTKKDASTAFDLLNGPLFRMVLFKLNEEEHFFKLTAHHIVCDGWSLGILLQDIGKLYSAYATGTIPSLPEALRFSQYSLEQGEYLDSPEYTKTLQYWLDQYKDSVPVLDVPTDFPRPALRTYKSQRDDYPLDGELVQAVKRLGAGVGCSFVMTLMAAFEVFLYRLTGQEDIILGLPAAGQSAAGYQHLVGHCVHLLPLRSRPKGDLSFPAYLKARKPKILDAYDHQQITFGTLLKHLSIARDPSRIPLVPVVFNIDMGLDNGVSFHGLQYRMTYNPREYESFEIFLNASGSERSLNLEWSYNTRLFRPSSIRRMMDGFEHLLREMTTRAETPIRNLPLMDSFARNHLLDTLNNTRLAYPKDKALYHLIDERAVITPDHPALQFQGRSLSYRSLAENSSRLAHHLQANGVRKGDVIGLSLDRSPEMVLALIAIWKAGAAYIPLDPSYPAERIEFMLKDAAATILLTSGKYRGRLHTPAKDLILEEGLEKLTDYPVTPPVNATGTDLAYILYTSGSTGTPKGVAIEHHNLINFMISMQKEPGIDAGDRLLAVTTISFDIAGLELYLPLISGATVVLADITSAKDGRILLDMVRSEKISIMQATPSTWRIMLDGGWNSPLSLKVLCGGEALPKDLAESLLGKCDSLWNMYGPTETTIWSTVKHLQPGDETISIGRPINNTQVYILDETGGPAALGAIGEILIGGDGVARGYHNRPVLTSERFVNNPFAKDGSKMYRTGDLGKLLENGDILCLGRIDHQVKIRGYRIELGEIEHSLTKQPGIREAVTIAREDRPGDQRLVAYIVPDQNSPVSDHQIQTWKKSLRNLLPDYMVPGEIVVMEKLPTTSNGKIDRSRLPKPGGHNQTADTGFIAPRTATEQLIADIWTRQLDIPGISINSDFFELGGHSHIAVKVMLALEKQTGRRFPLAIIFENSTVEKLAALIDAGEEKIRWDSLVSIKPTGTKMPIYMIHGAGLNVLVFNSLGKYMDMDQPVYGMQALGLSGKTQLLYSIEEIAQKYIAEILANNPDGPYALAGYSLGGFIAFEMAKQLMSMGKEVKMLGILDTHAGNRDSTEKKTTKAFKKMVRQFRKLAFFSRLFLTHPRRTIAYQAGILGGKIGKLFQRTYKVDEEFFTYEEEVNRSYDIAYEKYFMTPTDLKIDLFRVKQRIYYIDDPSYMEWLKYTNSGVEVHEVPGDHKTFLFPPNDREFARILQACLDERSREEIVRLHEVGTKKQVLRAV